jgi:hypothetical protein
VDLPRPEQLSDVPRRIAATVALVLGVTAVVVVLILQDHLWDTPDWRISVPPLVATAGAAFASIVRRERAYPLWLAGLGLAGAAAVIGWFLMLAIVIGATALLIVILHHVM